MPSHPCIADLCTVCGKTPGRVCAETARWVAEEIELFDHPEPEPTPPPRLPKGTWLRQDGWDAFGRRTYREPRDIGE